MLQYISNGRLLKFSENAIFPKIETISRNDNKVYLIRSFKNTKYFLSPRFFIENDTIQQFIKKTKKEIKNKNDTIENISSQSKFIRFVNIYEKYISAYIWKDFKFNFFKRGKKSLFEQLKEIYLILFKMNIDFETFISYCFENSRDILIPHPNRMKYCLKDFDLKYKRKKLFIDIIPYLIDSTKEVLKNEIEYSSFSEIVLEKKINPFIMCFRKEIINDIFSGKMTKDIYNGECGKRYWKRILVSFLILKDYTSLKKKMINFDCGEIINII